jgi:hypothetical protein
LSVIVFGCGALAAGVASTGTASVHPVKAVGRSDEIRAFDRPARATDVFPRNVRGFGHLTASRRIATVKGFRGRAALYVLRTTRGTCEVLVDSGRAGGGCSPSKSFLSGPRQVNAGKGLGFIAGVVANTVTRVVLIRANRKAEPVSLTHDKGFVYICPLHNGCSAILATAGYNRHGRLVAHQRLG